MFSRDKARLVLEVLNKLDYSIARLLDCSTTRLLDYSIARLLDYSTTRYNLLGQSLKKLVSDEEYAQKNKEYL